VNERNEHAANLSFFPGTRIQHLPCREARRRWSWPQFFVVVATLVAVPVVLVQVIKNVAWLQDKPGLFTLVLVSLILLSVGALAYALNKYWPLPNKPRR
jgi:predicted membrane channel-forming protein YqfA (hemolysin III family)